MPHKPIAAAAAADYYIVFHVNMLDRLLCYYANAMWCRFKFNLFYFCDFTRYNFVVGAATVKSVIISFFLVQKRKESELRVKQQPFGIETTAATQC